jgi:hypothetical protein
MMGLQTAGYSQQITRLCNLQYQQGTKGSSYITWSGIIEAFH